MSRLAHSALHRVRPGRAAIAAVTALLGACVLQPTTATAVAEDPASQAAVGAGTRADGSAPSGVSVLSDKWTRPWAISFLPDGKRALVTERRSATVWVQNSDGSKKKVGAVPNTVVPSPARKIGSGGLLGVAPSPTWNGTTDKDVFFVHTAAADIRVVKMHFDGTSLSHYTVVLGGITRGGDHNGGKIAFGPDGYLYVSVGDALRGTLAQDRNSLNGKILRITKSGAAAPGNPFGNRVYSLGHRNPQGLAWDARGRLWETEIGESTWDELNLISPGANYGWPTCEGSCAKAGMTNPKKVWHPDQGGVPAQIAIKRDVIYVSTLLGQRLWALPIDSTGKSVGTAKSYYNGAYGRLRAIAKVPGRDELWVGTTDRGDDKDRILKIRVK
ncbi:PQQ-dependent sugar dehydrogenase [Streptomyces sp. NPDC006334]|uniref:PQQ-dependent sugar dehydrogenase n=1 Tax=Streptomyces sp. NPDC006334 TaxID=3156754 RepID=UPI0033BF0528